MLKLVLNFENIHERINNAIPILKPAVYPKWRPQ